MNQCWNIINWTLGNKFQWNFNWNSNIFIQENVCETVVCEMASTSFRPQCVKLISHLHSFVHKFSLNCPIFYKFYTKHGSLTAVLCVKFLNDWEIEMDFMDEWDFMTRWDCEFKMSFRGISEKVNLWIYFLLGIFCMAQSLGYFTLSRLWYRLFIAWFTENLPNCETTCSWQKIYMYWQCSGWSFIMFGAVVDTTAWIVLFVLNILSVYLCGN